MTEVDTGDIVWAGNRLWLVGARDFDREPRCGARDDPDDHHHHIEDLAVSSGVPNADKSKYRSRLKTRAGSLDRELVWKSLDEIAIRHSHGEKLTYLYNLYSKKLSVSVSTLRRLYYSFRLNGKSMRIPQHEAQIGRKKEHAYWIQAATRNFENLQKKGRVRTIDVIRLSNEQTASSRKSDGRGIPPQATAYRLVNRIAQEYEEKGRNHRNCASEDSHQLNSDPIFARAPREVLIAGKLKIKNIYLQDLFPADIEMHLLLDAFSGEIYSVNFSFHDIKSSSDLVNFGLRIPLMSDNIEEYFRTKHSQFPKFLIVEESDNNFLCMKSFLLNSLNISLKTHRGLSDISEYIQSKIPYLKSTPC